MSKNHSGKKTSSITSASHKRALFYVETKYYFLANIRQIVVSAKISKPIYWNSALERL